MDPVHSRLRPKLRSVTSPGCLLHKASPCAAATLCSGGLYHDLICTAVHVFQQCMKAIGKVHHQRSHMLQSVRLSAIFADCVYTLYLHAGTDCAGYHSLLLCRMVVGLGEASFVSLASPLIGTAKLCFFCTAHSFSARNMLLLLTLQCALCRSVAVSSALQAKPVQV